MIDHTAVNVSDQEAAKDFYSKALAPLGYRLLFEAGDFLGFGDAGAPDFGVVRRDPVGAGGMSRSGATTRTPSLPSTRQRSRRVGPTTARPACALTYHANYYAAFVRDADGNNIEAVCQTPQS